ncbi:MAG: VanZ family protein [Ruminococcus sp.]|nr:VanZ family protein [Ruminococcus sp.]
MKRKIFIIFSVVTMVLIFCFSMENSSESSHRSRGVTEFIVGFFADNYDDMSLSEKKHLLSQAEHIIRKLAHYSVYTVLGLLLSLSVSSGKFLSRGTLATLIFGFLYACSDEFHQYFVKGRACRFTDVMIDTGGVLTGILISVLLFRIYRYFKHKSSVNPL